ncbi:Atlastin-1 [Folsomia candida]|uniref:Atlastin-1 n=1 Tax=Folsomia candida TaxID=158441 RepID=A0A226CY06_FOLCA|nr:Atlastin-1 [Folsomia candida]
MESNIREWVRLVNNTKTEVGNTPICLISITGASLQGKPFLLTVILHVLERLSRGQTDYWEDLEQLNSLTGFRFKNETERDTVGLWLWSKPFIITKSDRTKIAVMLMDTHGVFDSYTTESDWAMLVCLSLLTSSCLIYNLSTDMQEDGLKLLNNFVKFGMLSLEKDSTATSSFQKLIFLIRDWNFPNIHAYGPRGGYNFLHEKLAATSNMSPDVTRVTQPLATCFEEISCFLMPNPGEASKFSEAFRENLRSFVDDLISYDELKPFKIGNNIIDGNSLLRYFKKYVQVLNGKTIYKTESFHVLDQLPKDFVAKLGESNESPKFDEQTTPTRLVSLQEEHRADSKTENAVDVNRRIFKSKVPVVKTSEIQDEESNSQIEKFQQDLQNNIDHLSKDFKEELHSTKKPTGKGEADTNRQNEIFTNAPTSLKQVQPLPKTKTRQQPRLKVKAQSSPSSIPVGIFFSLDKLSVAIFDRNNFAQFFKI